MSIPKVYLAKSNKANPDLVSRVRQDLSKFNIEIVEFTGGTYTHKPLLGCDLLIVVPDLTNSDIIVGKGLYEQIDAFGNAKDVEDILIVTKLVNNEIFIDMIEDAYVDDSRDYVNYGILSVLDGEESLTDTLEDAYFYNKKSIKESSVKSTENEYQYLLIKR